MAYTAGLACQPTWKMGQAVQRPGMVSGPCFSPMRPGVASGEEWAGAVCAVWCGSTAWCGPMALFVLPNRRRPRQYLATQRGEFGPIRHKHRPYGLSASVPGTQQPSGERPTVAEERPPLFAHSCRRQRAPLRPSKKRRDNRSVSMAAGVMWRISTS
jgi:hypothetical protein